MSIASQVEARGRREGEAMGEARGKKEAQLTIAQQLLSSGQTCAFVAKVTGLSLATVEGLKQQAHH